MMEGKPLPVYGDGKNIRDWLYVEDHNSAVWTVMTRGRIGETYNIGGENEWENIKLLDRLIEIVAEESGKNVADLRAPDHLRQGPPRPRPALRHRLLQAQERARLEAVRQLRRGPAEDRRAGTWTTPSG